MTVVPGCQGIRVAPAGHHDTRNVGKRCNCEQGPAGKVVAVSEAEPYRNNSSLFAPLSGKITTTTSCTFIHKKIVPVERGNRGRGFLDSSSRDQMQLGRTAAVPTAAFRSRRLTHVVVTASATGQEPSTSGRPQQPKGASSSAGFQLEVGRRIPTGPNGRPLIMGPEGQPVKVRLGSPITACRQQASPTPTHILSLAAAVADGAPR